METTRPDKPRVRVSGELKKQLSVFVPLAHYTRLRDEAARRGITLADLLREMMEPAYSELTRSRAQDS
ncbi:MAG: hypothetical protein AB7U20_11755 [Planctomycetaceae bacterium]